MCKMRYRRINPVNVQLKPFWKWYRRCRKVEGTDFSRCERAASSCTIIKDAMKPSIEMALCCGECKQRTRN